MFKFISIAANLAPVVQFVQQVVVSVATAMQFINRYSEQALLFATDPRR